MRIHVIKIIWSQMRAHMHCWPAGRCAVCAHVGTFRPQTKPFVATFIVRSARHHRKRIANECNSSRKKFFPSNAANWFSRRFASLTSFEYYFVIVRGFDGRLAADCSPIACSCGSRRTSVRAVASSMAYSLRIFDSNRFMRSTYSARKKLIL